MSNNLYKVVKLDRRYAWHQYFGYRVEVLSSGVGFLNAGRGHRFNQFRIWCWENFGPSSEASFWTEAQSRSIYVNQNLTYQYADNTKAKSMLSDKWCWEVRANDKHRTFLYFSDDTALAMFKINWPAKIQ
jgi:hypothetical protein